MNLLSGVPLVYNKISKIQCFITFKNGPKILEHTTNVSVRKAEKDKHTKEKN